MDRERHLRPHSDTAEQSVKRLGCHRTAPLRHEDMRRWAMLPLKPPERPYLVTLHGVDTRRAVLGAADV
jgi:hypothetical protein